MIMKNEKENSSIDKMLFNTFNLGDLEKMDPSLSDGFRMIYNKEVPVEIRLVEDEEKTQQGTQELIGVKILVQVL
jgi:hypothetical protein